MIRFLALAPALVLLTVVFVTSCGYKGPLVMPETPAAKKELPEKTSKQKTP